MCFILACLKEFFQTKISDLSGKKLILINFFGDKEFFE